MPRKCARCRCGCSPLRSGEEARSGEPRMDGGAGGRCMRDAVASGTANPWAQMTDDLEAGGEVLENLGDVFAELLQSTATGRTALSLREVGVDLTRQMVGQRPSLPGSRRTIQHSRLRR